MKRTYFYLFGLVMTLTSCVNGIAPSKNKITKKYSVEAFDNIASQGPSILYSSKVMPQL